MGWQVLPEKGMEFRVIKPKKRITWAVGKWTLASLLAVVVDDSFVSGIYVKREW